MKLSRYVAVIHRFLLCAEGIGFWTAVKVNFGARLLRVPVTLRLKNYNVDFRIRGGSCDVVPLTNFYSRFPYVPTSKVRTILDGGANIGDSAVILAKIYSPTVLVAMEPDPENFKLLLTNIAPFSQIKAVQAALWTKDTQLSLFGKEDSTVSSYVTEAGAGGLSVAARSIQSLAAEQGLAGFDLVKLDIEGAEREILEHERGSWLKHCLVFIIELHDHMAPGAGVALINAVQQWGPFRVRIGGEYLVFIRVIDGEDLKLHLTG
jgi:FkbM family methyltransferase